MTFQDFCAEMAPFENHIGIVADTDVVRLVGVGQDDMDCYYICKDRRGKEVWWSAVGAFETLIGLRRYEQIEATFMLNGCPPESFRREGYDRRASR